MLRFNIVLCYIQVCMHAQKQKTHTLFIHLSPSCNYEGVSMSFESKVLAFRNLVEEIKRRRPLVEGKTFRDDYIFVDFNRYNKCSFINCTLIFEFGICSFANCDFSRCKFEAKPGSPASLILEFDRSIKESASKERHR